MASIIPGYEYDIFISYRQKDNKYDGWVSEFIDHLKREIEATFKEDVSIYFDENPHGGLLEIHNVDKSLEAKLNSVIFMPVISQTYCDPKSFAWQNEFVAFNKMASADQIGRDIRLPSGNVCSRIVPIKIHDLDATDTELIENEMGCRLRAIEFIFSGAGVNRPLKPGDNPDKNLNRTYYRDQINKVANTVKEIIYGIHPDERKRATKSYQARREAVYIDEKPRPIAEAFAPPKRFPGKIMAPIILGLLLIVAIISLQKLIKKSGISKSETGVIQKAVAVLPVSNFTGNPDLAWIAEMIQSDLTGQLQGISNLIVRPKQTTHQFRNSEEPIQEIAKKLSVNNLIESSFKGTEDNLQIEIRVVEAFPEERYVYSASFIQSFKDLAGIYSDVINSILKGMEVKATEEEEKRVTAASGNVNPEVRKACARGLYHMNQLTPEGVELGIRYYKEAIDLDPADPEPYIGLARGYASAGHG
ncbi:MAG TPA: hypothetical protein DDW27_16355, partial [Bacteroidales bacterium]|nr:hypothetical protein [Bacteroidales bacterium]